MAAPGTEQGQSILEFLRDLPEVLSFSHYVRIPLDDWVEWVVKDWLVPNFRPVFRAMQWPVDQVLVGLNGMLQAVPFFVFLVVLTVIAWRYAGRGVAIFTILALAMILTAVFFCAVVGIPLGIAAARSDTFAAVLRPVLDIMQTIPSFVYLVPIVMLFGVGMVPGVIATIIFALPPIIRLTNLGIRQVREEMVEAGFAFGSTRRQVLMEIQIPLALKTIMAGLNQTLMLALSMVVIAALIGAGGLGLTVYTGLGRLDVGGAFQGGIGIVLIAIILDRITQALGSGKRQPSWTFRGMLGSLFRPGAAADEETVELPGATNR